MKRKSGVLLHISSLWGERSCGAFGKEARDFVDFLASAGFSYWQVLPFCLPDGFSSPYSSFSAFSVNPYFIDLEQLCDVGLISDEELAGCKQETPYVCEFDKLKNERLALLEKAAARVTLGKDFHTFFETHPHTEKFCEFMARRAANGGKPFWEWENDQSDTNVYDTWRFICYVFVRQWRSLKEYANSKGIKIIGDIPIYVSQDSSDVWEEPENFMLDERKRPKRVAGVPPDYFSEDGQLWGNPLYDWDKMKKDGYSWWCDRIAFMCEFFDCIRIDHFRGLEAFYSCEPGVANARDGVWMKGPGMDLIKALKKVVGEKQLVAEDLGVITPEVKALVDDSGFPGMRVFQFGFDGDPENTHLPYNYPKNCIAYTGTHDNDTLLGYLWSLDDGERSRILSYCGFEDGYWDRREAYYSVIRTMLECSADTVIFPLQDLLMYGSDTRMNVPGVESGNWGWRVTEEQLRSIDTERLKYLNELYGRYEDPQKKQKKNEIS